MRFKDVVVFNPQHELAGNLGVVLKILDEKIIVGVLTPPDYITQVECDSEDVTNLKRKYPFYIRINKEEETDYE